MVGKRTAGDRRNVPLWAVLVVAAVGLALIAVAVRAQVSMPQPPTSVGSIDPTSGPSPSGSPSDGPSSDEPGVAAPAPAGKVPLQASRPVDITIPAIGVRSAVIPIGLAQDGTLAVPQPGPNQDKTAWFENSPTPGQAGPSIIEGHVDTESGPSVFFELGRLRPGHKIKVTRQDGVRVVFTVNAVRNFAKSTFPTKVVYGSKDLSRSQLRLITCSDFDSSLGTHTGNAVVFAELTAVHRPK